MKRISKLEVSCPDGVVFKKIDFNQDELDKVVKFERAAKINAAVVYDGNIQEENSPELNWKSDRKNADKVEVYAWNTTPFKILYGFGGYPFTERDSNLNTNLGFIGQCVVQVSSFKDALVAFKSSDILTEAEASNVLRASIVEVIKSAIGSKLSRLHRKDVEEALYKIKNNKDNDGLEKQLKSFFGKKGLDLREFTLSVNFPADFEERYQEIMQSRADTKNAAKEIEILNKLNDKK